MRKLIQLLVIFVLSSALSPLVFAEQIKIAVINLEKALLTTKFAQQQQKSVTDSSEYKSLVEKFQLLQADLQALEKEANSKGMTWSNEQRAEHANKVKYKAADYQLARKEIESQRKNAIDAIKKQFEVSIKEVVEKIIKSEGIGLLLNAKTVHFAEPELDITSQVTAALDARD